MKYPDAPWKEDTRHERNLKIWREELDAFVPEKVLISMSIKRRR